MSNLVQVGLSPSKRLRTAWVSLLSDIGIPVYDTVVPEDDETPSFYVIIHDFTKALNETCKDENGWDCTVLIDIQQFQQQGYINHDNVDGIEETILNKVKLLNEFVVDDFDTESTRFINSRSQDVIQPPELGTGRNMVRTILTYEHTLYQVNQETAMLRYGYYDTEPDTNTISYQFSKIIPKESYSFDLNFSENAQGKYIAFSIDENEYTPTNWFNYEFNQGEIPDSVFKSAQLVDGRNIIISGSPFVFEDGNYNLRFT